MIDLIKPYFYFFLLDNLEIHFQLYLINFNKITRLKGMLSFKYLGVKIYVY